MIRIVYFDETDLKSIETSLIEVGVLKGKRVLIFENSKNGDWETLDITDVFKIMETK